MTKGKAIKLSGKSLHGLYELPWFIFPGEGFEQKSFPSFSGSHIEGSHNEALEQEEWFIIITAKIWLNI